MANRYAYEMQSFDRQAKTLFATINSGVLLTDNNSGVESVVIDATTITVNLADQWSMFLGASVMSDSASDFTLTTEDVANKQLVFTTATDFQAAGVVYLAMTMKNSSVR
jgi:hypothetical protein